MKSTGKFFAVFLVGALIAFGAIKGWNYNVKVDPPELSLIFKGVTFNLKFQEGQLYAHGKAKVFSGILQNRVGSFSGWEFHVDPDDGIGFAVIINEKLQKIINQKDDLDAGGPHLLIASPDSKLVAFDYGTSPTARGIEIRDENGAILLEDDYLLEVTWNNNAIEYGSAWEVPLDFNEETKECRDVGVALLVQQVSFDGKERKVLDVPVTVGCSN